MSSQDNQQAAREWLVTLRDEAQSLLDYASKHLDHMADTQQTAAYDWWIGRRDTLVELLEKLDRPAPPELRREVMKADSFAEAAFFGFEEDRIKAVREAIGALIDAADEVVGEYAARFGTESGGYVGPLDYEVGALSAALAKVAP